MQKLTRAFLLPFLGISIAALLSSLKAPVPPSTRPSLTPVDCNLKLQFIADVSTDRSCPTPNPQSNPQTVNGATALVTTQSHTYYCKITVEPVENIYNYNAATYKTTWVTSGQSMNIKVPREVPSTLIIDFYENCNACKGGTTGRPMFRGRAQLAPGQTHAFTLLSYSMKAGC
ncbi:hypothetical protein AAHN97_14845 [Chitinophaga niabensis]|uniref:hypothetical protein n=1 Tax=Chitinophaga niabensis TaxID=536979 RepID=UPI0031B9AE27